jgi:SAM-dependent methyltransferase|tara:strand:+ start:286 stop:900 length:615 start_codon:yes stop_codon:yes gene_type:complete
MLNIVKIFYSIIKTYKKDIIKVFFYEIYFFIKHFNSSKKIIYAAFFGRENRTIPCPLYYALIIANFANKKKIKSILDLGSGYGRLTNFLDYRTNAKIYGYEFDDEIFKKSLQVKNKNVILKKKNILKISKEINKIDCFIFSDPLKYKKDHEKVVIKIKKIKKNKKYFIIFINVNDSKSKIMNKKNLIKQHISSAKKNIKIYYLN